MYQFHFNLQFNHWNILEISYADIKCLGNAFDTRFVWLVLYAYLMKRYQMHSTYSYTQMVHSGKRLEFPQNKCTITIVIRMNVSTYPETASAKPERQENQLKWISCHAEDNRRENSLSICQSKIINLQSENFINGKLGTVCIACASVKLVCVVQ